MQALRLARPRAPLRRSLIVRGLATTVNPSHTHVVSTPSATTATSQQSIIPLSNVEAQWANLSQEEQITVHSQLEVLQKKDWKTLSIDEKKAGEFFLLASSRDSCYSTKEFVLTVFIGMFFCMVAML